MANAEVYENFWTVRKYEKHRRVGLLSDEQAIFDRLAGELRSARLLDIGVGAGRTTGPLLQRVKDYVGIDLSGGMVRACKRAFPSAELLEQDARNLSRFLPGSFEAVSFSFNGIDYVSHDDRQRILSEIARIVKPGGVLIFSSHNRDWVHARDFRLPKMLVLNPVRAAFRAARAVRCVFNRAINKPRERETPEYAMINDDEQSYGLLTYYISLDEVKKQLVAAGFAGEILAYNRQGQTTTRNTEDPWVYYTARK